MKVKIKNTHQVNVSVRRRDPNNWANFQQVSGLVKSASSGYVELTFTFTAEAGWEYFLHVQNNINTGTAVTYYADDIRVYYTGTVTETLCTDDNSYRFGYNGMAKIDEVYGDASTYDFGARIYDPRIGRWLAMDPLANQFPWQSPYVGFDNSPIGLNDPTGTESENPNENDPPEKKSINVAFFPKTLKDHNGAIPTMYENASKDGGKELIVKQVGNLKDMANELKKLSAQYNIVNVFIVGHGSEKGSAQIGDEWYNKTTLDDNKSLLKTIGTSLNQNGVFSKIIMLNCHVGKTDFISKFADLTSTVVLGSQSWNFSSGAFTGSRLFGVDWNTSYEKRPDPIDKSGTWSVAIPKGKLPLLINNVITIPAITINSNGSLGLSQQKDFERIKNIRNKMKQNPTLKFSE